MGFRRFYLLWVFLCLIIISCRHEPEIKEGINNSFSLAPSGQPIVNPHKGFVQYAWSSQYFTNKYWDATLASGKNKPGIIVL